MTDRPTITSPYDPALDELCRELAAMADALDASNDWPSVQLDLLARYGVYQWFMPAAWGGQDWGDEELIQGYLRLSEACLTTTFIITQRTGACRRLVDSSNDALKERLARPLALGESFATVGISHLTTSRRHLGKPALWARETAAGFVLDGFSPWVTGAIHAEHVVTGATLDDGRQILTVVPTSLPGVNCEPPAKLVGLSASHTGAVRFDSVELPREWLLAGPIENVMAQGGVGGNTGGLQTSTLAIGLASAAITYLEGEAIKRSELVDPCESLRGEHTALVHDLMAAAGDRTACSVDDLRLRANQMVMRATQAALTAAKGTGYVVGHPTGRWCREAMFFLVWSCPAPVANASLCALAGLGE